MPGPGAHLYLSKGRVSRVSSQFFSELMILRVHSFCIYFLFPFVSDFTLSTLVLFLLLHFSFRKHTLSPFYFDFHKSKQPRRKGEISELIFSLNKWIAPFGAKTLLLLINPCRLAPKYFEYFIGSAPPLFILDPLSGSAQANFLCI